MSFLNSKLKIIRFTRNSKLEIKNSSRSAFSLVELLLYVGIFATVMTVFTGIFTVMNKVGTNQSVTAEVSQQTQFVLQTIQRLVRQTSVIDVADNTPVTDLKLRMTDPTQSVVDIYLDVPTNSIKMKVHNDTTNTDTITDITNNKVVANSLSFTKVATAGGHDVVQVSLTLTFNSQAKDQQISKTLNTAIARVSAATFDSDLIPNLDNSYSVGVTANRWKNAYFSGVAGIGTASPLSKLDVNGGTAIGTYAGVSAAPANGMIVSGNVGIGTATPVKKLEVNTVHAANIDDEIRLGSYYLNNFFGIGLNYRLNSVGMPSQHIVSYAGGTRTTNLSLLTSGNVGIGTASPLSKLDVNGGTAIGTYAGVSAAPANGMIVSGNVGIGTTAPATNLDVSGTVNVSVGGTTFSATGGTITYAGGYTIHTFTTGGTFTPSGSGMVEYLVVGGGGSGGTSQPGSGGGGGGGAGGLLAGTISVNAQPYAITVGAGGTSQTAAASRGISGGNSTFSTITALGGGGGGAALNNGGAGGDPGAVGGSGGGAGYNGYGVNNGAAGTAGQGNAGGNTLSNNNGGGGGGAGGVGGNTNSGGPSGMGGVGGAGLSSSISGVAAVYAKGGEGGGPPSGFANGAANTGNGGSGVYAAGASGAGGSGIVIIRYLTSAIVNPVNVLRTTSLGNVGIGTITPGSKLHIVDGNQQVQFLTGTNTSGYTFQLGVNDDGVNFISSSAGRGFNFKNGNGTLVTIGNTGTVGIAGNVGIGTGASAPISRLQVSSGATTGSANFSASVVPTLSLGTAAGSYGALRLYAGSDWGTQGTFGLIKVTNGNLHIDAAPGAYGTYLNWYGGNSTIIGNGAAGYGPIYASAHVVASSRASKRDIISSNYGIADITKLDPIKFKYINDIYNKENIGFIAEDVQKIIPEIVEVDKNGKATGIDYGKVSVILVGAIKEQQKQIDDQNQRIKILESELQSLKN